MSDIEVNGLPVHGYRPQNSINIELVNLNKEAEEQILCLLDDLANLDTVDKRWLAIGRTKVEEAFMAINRSIFKPERLT